MAATTRDATMTIKMGGKAMPTSRIRLFSRSCGVYLEASMSPSVTLRKGDELSVHYSDVSCEHLLATVKVFSIPLVDGKVKVLATDVFRDALKTVVSAAGWRKATVKEIAEDVLGECDVERVDLSALPSIILPHFSYRGQSAWTVMGMLIDAAKAIDGTELAVLPDPEGVLRFGLSDSLVKTPDYSTEFFAGDVLSLGRDHMKLHLVPVLFGQSMTYEGEEHIVSSVIHTVSADSRETDVWMQ